MLSLLDNKQTAVLLECGVNCNRVRVYKTSIIFIQIFAITNLVNCLKISGLI